MMLCIMYLRASVNAIKFTALGLQVLSFRLTILWVMANEAKAYVCCYSRYRITVIKIFIIRASFGTYYKQLY